MLELLNKLIPNVMADLPRLYQSIIQTFVMLFYSGIISFFIGGFLGSGFDLVIAGSILIKNSVGSCGILLLAFALAGPLIQLIVYNVFLKLSAAVVEPIGDAGIADFLSSLAGTINYFTAGILVVGFMYFVTMLLLICSSNTLF